MIALCAVHAQLADGGHLRGVLHRLGDDQAVQAVRHFPQRADEEPAVAVLRQGVGVASVDLDVAQLQARQIAERIEAAAEVIQPQAAAGPRQQPGQLAQRRQLNKVRLSLIEPFSNTCCLLVFVAACLL